MKTVAVDFDGTLCTDEYPYIGSPNLSLILALKRFRSRGGNIILWTCREGELLADAVSWCHYKGLDFDAVNENLSENIEKYRTDSRKVFADLYIDDRSANPSRCLVLSND